MIECILIEGEEKFVNEMDQLTSKASARLILQREEHKLLEK